MGILSGNYRSNFFFFFSISLLNEFSLSLLPKLEQLHLNGQSNEVLNSAGDGWSGESCFAFEAVKLFPGMDTTVA